MELRPGRSPGFDLDPLIDNLSASCPACLLPAWPVQRITSIHIQEGSNAYSPFTLTKIPLRYRGDYPSTSEKANITTNTNHKKPMLTAALNLDATKRAPPRKWPGRGKGISHKKVLNFTSLAQAASHVLLPQPFLQRLELNFTHQVHVQAHLPLYSHQGHSGGAGQLLNPRGLKRKLLLRLSCLCFHRMCPPCPLCCFWAKHW